MLTFSGGCGEDIHVAAIFDFEAFAQFCDCEWKVARGDIGFSDACQRLAQLALIHRRHALHNEASAGKAINGFVGKKEMAVAAHGRHAISSCQLVEAACFHD